MIGTLSRLSRAIYFFPAVIGVSTGAGLVAALIGDGIWDVASWIGLGIPIAVTSWFWTNRA